MMIRVRRKGGKARKVSGGLVPKSSELKVGEC